MMNVFSTVPVIEIRLGEFYERIAGLRRLRVISGETVREVIFGELLVARIRFLPHLEWE
jgi:hypothetical protein